MPLLPPWLLVAALVVELIRRAHGKIVWTSCGQSTIAINGDSPPGGSWWMDEVCRWAGATGDVVAEKEGAGVGGRGGPRELGLLCL